MDAIEQLKLAQEQVKFVTALVQFTTAKIVAFGALCTLLGYLIGRAF